MAYLNSNNIKIFPFGSERLIYDPFGRVLNEQNLVRLIKSLVDNDSYVISYDSDTHACTFVIGGYYCECNISEVIQDDKPLVASITLAESSIENISYKYLSGNDGTDGTFTAVNFSDAPIDGASATLLILDEEGKVPASSWKKFNNTSVGNNYKWIDCGTAQDVVEDSE